MVRYDDEGHVCNHEIDLHAALERLKEKLKALGKDFERDIEDIKKKIEDHFHRHHSEEPV